MTTLAVNDLGKLSKGEYQVIYLNVNRKYT